MLKKAFSLTVASADPVLIGFYDRNLKVLQVRTQFQKQARPEPTRNSFLSWIKLVLITILRPLLPHQFGAIDPVKTSQA